LTITIDDYAVFRAVFDSHKFSGGSLDAIKEDIDAVLDEKGIEVKLYHISGYRRSPEKVTIVRLNPYRSNWKLVFIDKKGNEYNALATGFYKDNKDTRRIISIDKELLKLHKEREALCRKARIPKEKLLELCEKAYLKKKK